MPLDGNDEMGKMLRALVAAGTFELLAYPREQGVELTRVGGNGFYDFYRGGPMRIGSIDVSDVDVRVHKQVAGTGLIALSIDGPSLRPRLADAQRNYPTGALSSVSGSSPDELVYYFVEQTWGHLRFGFHHAAPHPLAVVILDCTRVLA